MRKDTYVVIAPTTDLLYYGSCVLKRVIERAVGSGQRAVVLWGDGATASNARDAIAGEDPAAVFGLGHGSECSYTVQGKELFLSTCPPMNMDLVGGRVWFLNSCEVGADLGRRMVRDYGAVAFIGSSKPFLFPIVAPPCSMHEVMAPFEAEYRAVELLIRGYTVGEAHRARLNQYGRLIDYYTFGSGNASIYSDLVVRLLEIDKMIAVAYGDMNATVATKRREEGRDFSNVIPLAVIAGAAILRHIYS